MSAALDSKVEQALTAYLAALTVPLSTTNIYTGKSSGEKTPPCVEAICEPGGEEYPIDSGNFWKEATVLVKTSAPVDTDGVDPKTADDNLAAAVEEALRVDDLHTQLSAVMPAFHCYRAFFQAGSFSTEGDVWTTAIPLRLYCCNKDLPA